MSDTEQIKSKIDIVDFIGEYVQLKAAGINHKGLCPFHSEKSPSFMASRERSSWHCFGCNKGGDVFTFLQEIEGMEFVEALKYLADKAGVELTFKQSEVHSSQRNRLRDINTDAARFFHNFLMRMDASKDARAYLHDRGLTDETIEAWQIGFVPDQWELLTKYLLKKNHSIDDLVASGLTIKRDGAQAGRGFYDRFRGRIMFPIRDVHGYTVGFTGRVLVETEKSGGKYVNTPQTIIFDKSRVLFGLSQAKQEIKKQNLAVLVEGQMDVIACHQAGMTNVVASSGTALTEEQIHILKRYAKHMNMAFDADEAGQKAAKRGIDIALEQGMNIKVIQIPDGAGKDPDDCIRQDPAVWFAAVQNAQDVMQWYVKKAFAGKDTSDPKDKQAISDELLPEIARIPYAIEQDHWLRGVAGRIGVDVSLLRQDMTRLAKEAQKKVPQKSLGATRGGTMSVTSAPLPVAETRAHIFMKRFLMLFFSHPSKDLFDTMSGTIWSSFGPRYQALYESIQNSYTTTNSFHIDMLLGSQEPDMTQWVNMLLLEADEEFSAISERELEHETALLVEEITKEWKKNRRVALQQQLEEAEAAGDTERVQDILKQFQ
ncbi:MAG: DNA primase [Candidatus Magasanikbacteria bacterium CG10_big_fil_rev_8_21_14_0_10_43_6]|uniref:DNA primase n=1 Tax=Candidatus Magasanikbacteria bacterium CG10_big_fil_rev_8_21_14_0_10_43_6 TaxID=1974650 RepID=A0A2M6W0L9_9BACT|nr:MAG: DNA primase [Candidatus Magasanikbacteria bacterium CG10_big_fil_rev_8_21_14_0_10_43_6]